MEPSEGKPLANPGPPRKAGKEGKRRANRSDPMLGGNRFVSGNFYPTASEGNMEVACLEGSLPLDLEGMYTRVGPNPRFDTSGTDYHPFDGDGMVHAVTFFGGERNRRGVANYDKRWIRTKRLQAAEERGWDVFPFGEMSQGNYRNFRYTVDETGQAMGPANTNLMTLDRRTYALYESDKPYRIAATDSPSSNLATMGRESFGGQLSHPVAAHPKADYKTKELILFGYDMMAKPFHIGYSVLPADGGQARTQLKIPIESPRMMHDMAITANYSVLFDPNYLYEMDRAMSGQDPWVNHLDRPARFGIFPRHAKSPDELKWIDVSACGLFHFANSWEDPKTGHIVVWGCRAVQMRVDEFGRAPITRMHRWILDYKTSKLIEERSISNLLCDFPQCDARNWGYPTKYVYAVEFESDMSTCEVKNAFPYFRSVLKFDTENLTVTQHVCRSQAGNQLRLSEAVFAPSTRANQPEDAGYLVCFAHDETTNRSETVVYDARTLRLQARLPMPVRVPYGFHSHWILKEEIVKGEPHSRL